MKKVILFYLIPLLLTLPSCKGKKEVEESSEKTFEKAKIYENIKQYPKAIEAYDAVLQKTPFFLDAYIRKGFCYQALGNYNDALETYKKGFVIDSENIQLMRSMAEVYYLKGNYEEAIKYTDLVREKETTDPFNFNLIGKIYAAKGEMEEALVWFKRAIESQPDKSVYILDYIRVLIAQEQVDEALLFTQSYMDRLKEDAHIDVSLMHADLLMRTNRFEEVFTFLTALEEKDKENSEILSRIARYYFINEEDEKSIAYLERSLKKTPSHLQSLLLKGSLLLKQDKGPESLVIFQTLSRNFPNWPDVQLKLGAAYQLMGQWEQAKTAYRRLLQMVPGFIPAQVSLANIYFRDGWYEEVEKISEEIFEKEPNNVDALKIYAASLLTQKKYPEAIEIYKQIIELTPEMKQSHAFLAELYLSNGNFQSAYLEAQKALKMAPDDNRMLLVSGLALKFLKLNDRSQAVFRKIIENDPGYLPARFQLGELYAAQKLWQASEEQYQAILDKQPENIDVLIRIGSVYWRQGQFDKAEEFFLALLERFPEEYRLYYELGRLYTQQKKLDEAIEKFEEVVERKPQHLLGNLLLANLYRQNGNVERPEEIIRTLIAARPGLNLENELVLLQLAQGKVSEALRTVRSLPVQKQRSVKTQFAKGIALLLSNEAEDAAITFRRLQEKLPFNLMFLLSYADSYLLLGSEKKALGTFENELGEFKDIRDWYKSFSKKVTSTNEKVAVLDKAHLFLLFSFFQWGVQFEEAYDSLPPEIANSPLMKIILANAYTSSEKWDQAKAILEELSSEYPKSSFVQYQLGLYFIKREETSSATQALIAAMQLNQDSIRIRIPLMKLLLDNKQYLEMEQIALDTLKKAPNKSTTYYLLADLYGQQKRYQKAIELMSQLSEIDAKEINASLRLGQLYFNQHEYDKSADSLRTFVSKNPRHLVGNSLYLRALLASDRDDDLVRLINSIKQNIPRLNTTMPEILFYLKKGEYKKSSRLLQKIDATAFVSGPNLFVMGLVFEAMGDLDQAKKYFLMGSEKTDDKLLYFLAYLNLMKVSVSKDEFSKALTEMVRDSEGSLAYSNMLEAIVSTNESSAAAAELFQLNLIYLDILNTWNKKGYKKLEPWIERFPKNLFFYRIAYFLAEKSRWTDKGVENLEKIVKYYPNDIFALMQLARYRLGEKDQTAASDYLETVLKVMPDNQEALTLLGMIYSNTDNIEKALKLYEKALELNENNVIVLNNLAYLYSASEEIADLDRALTFAEKAQKISPANGPISDTLGWLYYQKGQYAQALVYLERARQVIPRFPEVHYHLGKTYVALKDKEKAKEAFEQALKLDPKGEHSQACKDILATL